MIGRGPLLLLIVLLSLFAPLSTDMYLSGLPEMVEYYGTTESVMNMTLYMFMLALSVGVLLLGPVSDRYGRRRVLVASLALYTAASAACALAPDVWSLIAMRVIQAVGGAGALCISVALIKDCFEGREMARMMSVTSALAVIGPIVAPVAGNALIQTAGWQSTFWVPAVLSLLCLAMSLGIPSDIPRHRPEGTLGDAMREVGAVARDRDFTGFTLMMTVFMCGQLAYISVSAYVFQGTFGMSSTGYSLALAAALVGGIALMLILQRVVGNRRTVTVLSVILALGAVGLAAMAVLGHLHWTLFMVAFVPCSATAMLARSYGFNILMSQREDGSGAVSSVINFASFGFCCIGMVVASMPWDSYFTGISVALALGCVLFVAMWAMVARDGYPLKGLDRSGRES